jgi:hypothetical protein
VTDLLTLDLPEAGLRPYQLEIHNALGQRVHAQSLRSPTIQLNFLPRGLYVVRLFDEEGPIASTSIVKE